MKKCRAGLGFVRGERTLWLDACCLLIAVISCERQVSVLLFCCTSSEKRCAYEERLMFMIKVNEGT